MCDPKVYGLSREDLEVVIFHGLILLYEGRDGHLGACGCALRRVEAHGRVVHVGAWSCVLRIVVDVHRWVVHGWRAKLIRLSIRSLKMSKRRVYRHVTRGVAKINVLSLMNWQPK